MRFARSLCALALFTAALAIGCSDAQKTSFNKAMTGAAALPAPGQVPPLPTPDSIEGRTVTAGQVAATVAQASAGTPIAGYATFASAFFGGLLVLEKLLGTMGINLPNSKGSQSASNSTSAGGKSSETDPLLPSNNLRAA